MQHIIVPVDLSPNSKAALRYAAHIAAAAKVGITIVFAYSLLEKAIRYTTKKGQVDKDPQKWIQNRIDKIHAKRPEVDVQSKIIKGDILDSLRRMVDITGAGLIVMGCQGKDENMETYLGSTAVEVIKTSPVPVMLIPSKFKFKGLQQIVLATNNTSANSIESHEPINQLRQVFQPGIFLLQLGNDLVDHEKAILILQDNLNQQKADLLILIRQENGFLETNMAPPRILAGKFNIHIPLLVLVGEDS